MATSHVQVLVEFTKKLPGTFLFNIQSEFLLSIYGFFNYSVVILWDCICYRYSYCQPVLHVIISLSTWWDIVLLRKASLFIVKWESSSNWFKSGQVFDLLIKILTLPCQSWPPAHNSRLLAMFAPKVLCW